MFERKEDNIVGTVGSPEEMPTSGGMPLSPLKFP